MEYYGIVRQRPKWFTPLAIAVCLVIIAREILVRQVGLIPVCIIVIIACFFKKEHVICEEGVDIRYALFGIDYCNRWEWSKITTLHVDRKRAYPKFMLHIGKDIVTRSYVMNPEDCIAAVRMGKKKNPKIYIEE